MPPIRRVLVLAVEGTESLDILGPVEVFDYADREVPGSYRIDVVGPSTDGLITMSNRLRLGVSPLPEPPPRHDTLVVAGGAGARRAIDDPAIVDWIVRASRRARRTTSVCTGAYLLAAAGLLDGRRATTHWMYAATMAEMYPSIDVDPDVLYVQDGRIITSAGTAAGLDACLHLLRQELGAEMTNTIARRMVVPPQRDGGQAQFILHPLPEVASLSLSPVTDWMLENLRMELTVDQLATKAHMSPRTFARRFKADYGTTPAAWLGRQRIIHAQRLLEQTDLGLDRIAYECGFGSASVLRQNFSRVLGTTPTAYRATFCCEIGMGGSALERREAEREAELAGSAA